MKLLVMLYVLNLRTVLCNLWIDLRLLNNIVTLKQFSYKYLVCLSRSTLSILNVSELSCAGPLADTARVFTLFVSFRKILRSHRLQTNKRNILPTKSLFLILSHRHHYSTVYQCGNIPFFRCGIHIESQRRPAYYFDNSTKHP